MMSNERDALMQLDAILTSSQDNLIAQRERFRTLGDAVRRRRERCWSSCFVVIPRPR